MKTYSLAIILTLSFGLFSCSNSTDKKEIDKTKTHERLIDCKTKYVMEDGEEADGYHEDYENFIKDYFSEEQIGDTLIVTTLIEVNACGKTIGDIEFSGDTLFLKTRQIADEVCTSTMFEKFIYRIHNPDNKRYEIQSER
ncbi:MAG: hypothetical protein M0R38_00005 [Bacteroidia bacterium]|nr:hypothetical protein [Bacteroidia bacterium]